MHRTLNKKAVHSSLNFFKLNKSRQKETDKQIIKKRASIINTFPQVNVIILIVHLNLSYFYTRICPVADLLISSRC